MNVFTAIMTVLVIVAALIFAFGVLMLGLGVLLATYGCMTDNPNDRFVIGIDYGKQMLNCLDRAVDATERCVDISEKAINATLDEEEYEEAEDFSNM